MIVLQIFITLFIRIFAEKIEVQEIQLANNLFASSIYKVVYPSTNKSFALSPLSTETSFAFLQSGCKNSTAEEIQKALHLPNNNEYILDGFGSFIPSLIGNGFYIAQIINKLYVSKNIKIKTSFKKTAKSVFKAETANINFRKKAKAVNTINKWVEKNTESKIKDLLTLDDLNINSRLILVNAFYFRAKWMAPFTTNLTRKALFYKNIFDTVAVDTMFQDGEFQDYYENNELNAKFLKLSFKELKASLTLVLPNAKDGLPSLEDNIESVLKPQPFVHTMVDTAVPKFKIETRCYLKNLLKTLGVNRVFNRTSADLSKIAGKKGNLFVDDAIQKIYLNVNEYGVEAAATAEVSVNRARSLSTKQFIADHPFLFYLQIEKFVVLVGRVLDPSILN